MATRSLGTLTLDIITKLGGFQSGMSKAERIAKDSAAKIDRTFKNLGRTFRTAFAFLTTGVAASAVKRFVELGDELNKAATKAGVSAEAISELAYAAKLADVDVVGLSTALQFMQTNLSKADTGAKKSNLAIAALGLSLEQIQQLEPDKQFELLAERISQLQDPADKARAATELFGAAGASLLPLFEDGAEGIRKAREEAERLGLSFSGKQLDNLSKADDAIKTLKASFEGLGISLAERVAPSLSYFLEGVNSLVSGREIDRLKVLKEEIRVLDESIARGGGTFLTPFVSLGAAGGAPDVAAGIYSLEEQVEKVAELRKRLRALTAPGRGGGSVSDVLVPGYKAAADELKEAGSGIEEVLVTSSKIAVDATTDLYRQWEEETQTATETILQEWEDFESKVNALLALGVENGGITAEEAGARLSEYSESIIQEVEVLGKKLGHLLKEETEEISEFQLQAFRNTQDIISNFLDNAFQGQFDNILTSFVRMIDQMVAQALAAQLAEKLFGGDGKGGGWLDSLFSWGASFFGGGRAAGGSVLGGQMYRVNEGGGVEALSIPGMQDYLLMGSKSGQVVPANQVARGGGVTQNIIVQGRVDQRSARQLELEAGSRQRMAAMRLA